MATPVRDFWPLTPRPAVLPLPEPMPRPTRMRRLRAPALSAISLSFIVRSLSGFLGAHEVAHLVDHAAHRGRILEHAAAMPFVEAEALERGELVVRAADRAAGLGDLDLLGLGHGHAPQAAASLACSPSRRPIRSPTFLPRRVATMRGELSCCRAAKV